MKHIRPRLFVKLCGYIDNLADGELLDICENNNNRRSYTFNMLLLTKLESRFRDSSKQYRLSQMNRLASYVRGATGHWYKS